MFFDDHKKAVATMMAKRKPGSGELVAGPAPMKAEVSKNEDGTMDGRHAAAEDAIAAFHEKSAHKLKAALSNFIDIHNSEPKNESASDDLES